MTTILSAGTDLSRRIYIAKRTDGNAVFDVSDDCNTICTDLTRGQARLVVEGLFAIFPNLGALVLDPVEQILHNYGVDPEHLTFVANAIRKEINPE